MIAATHQKPLDVIVMAAGKGTRLKSDCPKVLHPLFGKSLLQRVLDILCPLQPSLCIETVYVVVGHGREAVMAHLERMTLPFSVKSVVQEPQLGTGHAVMQVQPYLAGDPRDVLVLSGDVPLLRAETLQTLVTRHRQEKSDLTVLGAALESPTGYGRLVMKADQLASIVEEKDASEAQRMIREVNAGVYCLNWTAISPLLERLSDDNAQGEFYLTDLIGLGNAAGLILRHSLLEDPQEMLGVNSRADLARCHAAINERMQRHWMAEGVTILSPATTLIGPEVAVGRDTVILPGTSLLGKVTLGEGCEIGPHTTMLGDVRVGNGSRVIHSVVKDSTIGENSTVGPFAHLRDHAELSHHVRVGNFVEVKNTRIDHHSNAAHLSYLGDADLGSRVNMGAGSITANYDPIRDEKHRTVIEDGVKVGCNSVLVAPLCLQEHSSVAAGSVITRNVAPWDLAIARPRQTEIRQWVAKTLKRQSNTPSGNTP